MIVLRLSMLEGRTVEQKKALIRRLTDAAARHLGWSPDEVRVIIYEISKDEWGVGGGRTAREREAGRA